MVRRNEANKIIGYTYLKPYLMNFLRCVHIISDKDIDFEN